MTTKLITQIVISVSVVGWCIYTAVMASNSLPGDTISEVVRETCRQYPLVPFLMGVVVGHWLWSMSE